MLKEMAEKLRAARSVALTTHRHCDGDGLGSELALFHGLRKAGKSVRILNLDRPPKKYSFLDTEQWIEVFDPTHTTLTATDMALIFDTNDERLVEPLFSALKKNCRDILFLDHHPHLNQGPKPTTGSVIDTGAASTGELCFRLLNMLGISLDPAIARALYTSVVFDTQMFRYVKSKSDSHVMSAELLKHEKNPEEVHRMLFSTYTVGKMRLLAQALSRVEYFAQDRAAFVALRSDDFRHAGLERDDSGDIVDLIMNIGSIEVAALVREDGPHRFKLSLRSKGVVDVLGMAEGFGGGGHKFASGAHISGEFIPLRERLLRELTDLLGKLS